MQVTQEMYTKLFNAVTDAKTQLETEEMYINNEKS